MDKCLKINKGQEINLWLHMISYNNRAKFSRQELGIFWLELTKRDVMEHYLLHIKFNPYFHIQNTFSWLEIFDRRKC